MPTSKGWQPSCPSATWPWSRPWSSPSPRHRSCGGSTSPAARRRPTLAKRGAGSGRCKTWRVLTVLERKIGGDRGGSTQAVFALDVAGQKPGGGLRPGRWSASASSLDSRQSVLRPRRRGHGVRHVALCERARADGGEVLAFDAEPFCWRRFAGVGGATAWAEARRLCPLRRRRVRTPELRRGPPGHRLGPDGRAQARGLSPLLADRPLIRSVSVPSAASCCWLPAPPAAMTWPRP